ncbi:hypothetical protein BN14_07843 [Rhizoctonia solani AG-1 IB]|uniref:Major facilitator superfamily (MFS) profile domain-containing protein n=1 Tax=Thanatephorus cucumeris (strain AG1-IB / isolate 7/3/14) TaxID=1108050 RepID=M5CD27_THACB|nr:hypothetical protein BN14_07843 [Rhizoctonia solani AG-1 IB]
MSETRQEIELSSLGTDRLPSKFSFTSQVDPTSSDQVTNTSGLSFRDASQGEVSLGLSTSELPPVDVGFGAWSFVASAFLLDTIIWGFGFTYGVFQEYFIREKSFGDASEAALGAVGTVALGLQYCSALFVILLAQQWRRRIPIMMWICLGIWQLILIQGVFFGVGGGGLFAPVIVYLPEWFSFITSFVQALAYFPVSLYMSVYTTSLGLPPANGTIVVAVFNLAALIGQVLFGHFCDIAPYPYVIMISGAGASLSAYLLWGFAHNLGVIFAFVIVFGLMSGGFTSIWPAASADIVGPEHQATVPNVFGILGIGKGVAAIIGPVVAAALHHPHESAIRTAYSGYGFRDVTLFVGSMMFATAAGGVSSKLLSRR